MTDDSRLSRPFQETVIERAEQDHEFAVELVKEFIAGEGQKYHCATHGWYDSGRPCIHCAEQAQP